MAEGLPGRVLRGIGLLRREGLRAAWSRLRHGSPFDIVAKYAFLLEDEPVANAAGLDAARHTINWVLPAFTAGSGGHTNAFRFIRMLVARGYECRIVIHAGPWFGTAAEIAARLERDFGPVDAEVYGTGDVVPPAHAVVATGWDTAHWVRRFKPACERFYFVQDFEPWFHARGSEYCFAEETYSFGFTGITAGSWLSSKLQAEYGMTCHPVGFSYDKALYRAGPRPPSERRRVFFYARPSTARRGFEMGILALARLCAFRPDVTAVLAGFDTSSYVIPFPHESCGVVRPEDLPQTFRSCDVALVISTTNLSLMPLELMACEIPVVSNEGPWAEWLLSREIAVLAPARAEALAEAMGALLADEEARQRVGRAGRAFAETTSWEREGDAMAAAFASRGCVPESTDTR